jgi:glycosyltransferase involved in cell wall biosynthesis
MTVMPRLAANSKTKYWVFAIAMIRNDFDVVLPFLAQADELFDELFLVDVQSTDGTKEAITAFKAKNTKIHLYSIDRQEKYQSAIMNRLVREAFTQGAELGVLARCRRVYQHPT